MRNSNAKKLAEKTTACDSAPTPNLIRTLVSGEIHDIMQSSSSIVSRMRRLTKLRAELVELRESKSHLALQRVTLDIDNAIGAILAPPSGKMLPNLAANTG